MGRTPKASESFDGLWQGRNGLGSDIHIGGGLATWPKSGSCKLEVRGGKSCELEFQGQTHVGTLADDLGKITWSDGDVWLRSPLSPQAVNVHQRKLAENFRGEWKAQNGFGSTVRITQERATWANKAGEHKIEFIDSKPPTCRLDFFDGVHVGCLADEGSLIEWHDGDVWMRSSTQTHPHTLALGALQGHWEAHKGTGSLIKVKGSEAVWPSGAFELEVLRSDPPTFCLDFMGSQVEGTLSEGKIEWSDQDVWQRPSSCANPILQSFTLNKPPVPRTIKVNAQPVRVRQPLSREAAALLPQASSFNDKLFKTAIGEAPVGQEVNPEEEDGTPKSAQVPDHWGMQEPWQDSETDLDDSSGLSGQVPSAELLQPTSPRAKLELDPDRSSTGFREDTLPFDDVLSRLEGMQSEGSWLRVAVCSTFRQLEFRTCHSAISELRALQLPKGDSGAIANMYCQWALGVPEGRPRWSSEMLLSSVIARLREKVRQLRDCGESPQGPSRRDTNEVLVCVYTDDVLHFRVPGDAVKSLQDMRQRLQDESDALHALHHEKLQSQEASQKEQLLAAYQDVEVAAKLGEAASEKIRRTEEDLQRRRQEEDRALQQRQEAERDAERLRLEQEEADRRKREAEEAARFHEQQREEAKLREQQQLEAELEAKRKLELVKEQERKLGEQEELARAEAVRRTAEDAERERSRAEEREREERERLRVEEEKKKEEAVERERLEEEERRLQAERERQEREVASAEERERLESERLRLEEDKRKEEAVERERLAAEQRRLVAERERQEREEEERREEEARRKLEAEREQQRITEERLRLEEEERLRTEEEEKAKSAAEDALREAEEAQRLAEEARKEQERREAEDREAERKAEEAKRLVEQQEQQHVARERAMTEEEDKLRLEKQALEDAKEQQREAESNRVKAEKSLVTTSWRTSTSKQNLEEVQEKRRSEALEEAAMDDVALVEGEESSMAQSISYNTARKRDVARMSVMSMFNRKENKIGTTEPVAMWMWGDLSGLASRLPTSWSNPKGVSVVVQDLEKVKEKDKQRPITIRILGATNEPTKVGSVDAAIKFLGQIPQMANTSVVSAFRTGTTT